MTENTDHVQQLLQKLDILLKKQEDFSREINDLRREIYALKSASAESVRTTTPLSSLVPVREPAPALSARASGNTITSPPPVTKLRPPKSKSDVEKFIGENLANKIGILIIVTGVGIGAKYSVEHQLINPLTRILLGYLTGIVLLGFAIKLKQKYHNFSATLLSGSMSIFYFVTYSAHSFYDLIPRIPAFGLMLLFTVFIVIAAIRYDRQIIAHIGLVGAYAVPFLLSEDSGQVAVLFSYMALINAGVLAIAVKKLWKPLWYSSFGITWLIVTGWYLSDYRPDADFTLGLGFLCIFFVLFYLTLVSYQLLHRTSLGKEDTLLLLANAFVFYGLGYHMLDQRQNGPELLGLFTLGNALPHFALAMIIHKRQAVDRNLFYLIVGLVLVFITIAIPVQLDGNWVTLLWSGEAALLFWLGRTKAIAVYEKLAYPMIYLAFFSLVHDWSVSYGSYHYTIAAKNHIPFLLNIYLLTSLLFIAALGLINYLRRGHPSATPPFQWKPVNVFIDFSLPALLIFSLYYAFRIEIASYWDQLYAASTIETDNPNGNYKDYFMNYALNNFKAVWIINYSLFFVSALALVNYTRIRHLPLSRLSLLLMPLTLLVFLTQGLYELSELRDSWLAPLHPEYYPGNWLHVGIRYVSLGFAGLCLYACYRYIPRDTIKNFPLFYDCLLHVSLLWIASSELINWLDLAHSSQSYKLGLSILWGIYALMLIVLGIWKKKRHLRLGAMALFGITLLKLFFYDIAHLDTIAKTIVFVSLGMLLLIISFLYNKYKNSISDEAY